MVLGRAVWIQCFPNLPIETTMPAIDPPTPRQSVLSRSVDETIARLQELTFDRIDSADGLPLEGIDGLFCAAWLTPGADLAMDELLPVALGDMGVPPSNELLELLAWFWNFVGKRLTRAPDGDITDLLPVLLFPIQGDPGDPELEDIPPEFPVGAAWAAGFLMGCGLRQDAWEQRLERNDALQWQFIDIVDMAQVGDDAMSDFFDDEDEDEDEDFFDPSTMIEADIGNPSGSIEDEEVLESSFLDEPVPDESDEDEAWHESDEDESEPMTLDDRLELIADLPAFLHELHLTSIDERSNHVPVRRPAGPGRNDPCPCGSGLKFKRCHGDPGRLH